MGFHQMLRQRQLRVERLPADVTYPDLWVASLFVPVRSSAITSSSSLRRCVTQDSVGLPKPTGCHTCRIGRRLAIADLGTGESQTREESRMLAAMGLGFIGTILLIVLVIAAIMFFLRRA